jgi:hypothetical protein
MSGLTLPYRNYGNAPVLPRSRSFENLPLQASRYTQSRSSGDALMAIKPETLSWSSFQIVATLLMTVGVAAIGGGFAWLHSDLADVRTDVREIRGSVGTIGDRVRDTREDMVKAVGAIEKQAAITNTKLDDLIHKR